MPILDDVAEKARRNLMVISSGIVAVWALDIPLDGKLVGAVDLNAVEPWRAWVVATLVLIYFSLRYYFAPAKSDIWKEWRSRRKVKIRYALEDLRKTGIKSLESNERHPDIFFEVSSRPDGTDWRLSQKSEVSWHGCRGSFEYTWLKTHERRILGSNIAAETEKATAKFTIRAARYLSIQWQEWFRAYWPSEGLLELSIPWFLAFAAAVVCICKLVASVYYDWPFIRELLPA